MNQSIEGEATDEVRGALKSAYWMMDDGRGSEDHLKAALEDAAEAINQLPCECGEIQWPVVAKPERGSAEWWEDPGAYFACRNCGAYLADGHAYPVSRGPNREYPFGRDLPPPKEERQRRLQQARRNSQARRAERGQDAEESR